MVLVDYIGIFFTFPNTFDRCQTASLWFPSILLKKISKTTIIIDGPEYILHKSFQHPGGRTGICLNLRVTPEGNGNNHIYEERFILINYIRSNSV
jgi:hypothetical protein